MRQLCPLCGEVMIAQGSRGLKDACAACSRALIRLSAYLESLEFPVALIASDHTILLSNGHLREVFDYHERERTGMKIGEVLDCKNATSHSRCGETTMCLHCDLRRLAELSRLTGERLSGIRASFQRPSGAKTTCAISAEKAGEAILLTFVMKKK
jgi:hypothetical protein